MSNVAYIGDPRDSAAHVPANVEAEQALLGIVLLDNRALEAAEQLAPDDFFEPLHGRLWALIRDRAAAGIADPTLIGSRLVQAEDKAFIEAGGMRYLGDLVDKAPSASVAKDYAASIRDLAQRRTLIQFGQDVALQARRSDDGAPSIIEAAEQNLFSLAEQRGSQTGFEGLDHYARQASAMADEAHRKGGGLSGLSTGLVDLDRKLGGLHPSDLVIVGARPSMGKTGFLVNVGYRAAKRGVPAALFSLEMSGEQIATRIAAEAVGIGGDRMRRGAMGPEDLWRTQEAFAETGRVPFYIDDTGGLSVARLCTRARRLKRLKGVELILIDYVQLVTTTGRKNGSRVEDVTEITQALKALAKDLNVPVVAAAQLSRQVEQRDDKRPQLADLRESGSIEQDADVVMFLFRESYYLSRSEPKAGSPAHAAWQEKMAAVRNLAEIIIGKQRHGPIGTVKAGFNETLVSFTDWFDEDRYGAYGGAR